MIEILLPLDIFENNQSGIFTLLDEECRMPNPQTASFMQKVIQKHGNCISLSYSNKTANDTRNRTGFTIRHFGHDVLYAAVRKSELNKFQHK